MNLRKFNVRANSLKKTKNYSCSCMHLAKLYMILDKDSTDSIGVYSDGTNLSNQDTYFLHISPATVTVKCTKQPLK